MLTKLPGLRPAVIALCTCLALAPPPAIAQPLPQDGGVTTIAPMLSRVTPAVVNIAVVSETPAISNPLYNDPYFRRFFDLRDPPMRRQMSAGSGVIVDAENGYVLTNHHVVAEASAISVTLKDGRQLQARLVGADQATEIALLRIEAEGLTALEIGDSDRLQVGDFVAAIGNPFGLGQTVTSGIVSALGRSGISREGYEDFIQTDASINPGNSGGALVTLDGRLVGINTAILTPAGGNIGIGFAVPSNMAVAVMQQLIQHGEVRRGRLGIGMHDLTPDLAEALELGGVHGAVIANVEPDSPADKAGLKAGDVVTAIDGAPVQGATHLRNRLGLTPVGSPVQLTVRRAGSAQEIGLTMTVEAASSGDFAGTPLDGARLRDASRAEARRAGAAGIMVESVEPDSLAASAGLRRGDMIVAANRLRVASVADLREMVAGGRPIAALELIRDGRRIFMVAR
ncbi:Do family serine endopeptidase [Paracoccus siganidrum]|nr:Do family serine endopeptidase [Paracoccus siganidrum]RMC33010.1 serine endoprotease DegQ [Paracoccus siganidrum]